VLGFVLSGGDEDWEGELKGVEVVGVKAGAGEARRTSSADAGEAARGAGGLRGLVRCPYGHAMHADLNAAMNILKRGGGKVPMRVRVLSFTPTASKVILVNEKSSNAA
jgi:hypothetical protein